MIILSKKEKNNQEKDKIDPKLINSYLKKARFSVRDEDYYSAVKYYRLAAKCAAKAGDTQKEAIFNNRADEIIEEHNLDMDVEKEKIYKKPKKATAKKEKLRITGLSIWGFLITIIIIVIGLSSVIYMVLFLPSSLTVSDMFFYWGIGIIIEIVSVILIVLIYKFLIKPPEIEEEQIKK